MAWKDRFLQFVKKYGTPAKVVATSVLGVVAPEAVVKLVEKVFEVAQDAAQGQWEAELLRSTQQNTAELVRLGDVFELLTGDLAKLCDKAFAFHDQPNDMEDIVRRALAADRGLADGLRKLDGLCDGMICVQQQQRQLLAGQDEMLPILRRLDCVNVVFAEWLSAGASPAEVREMFVHRKTILRGIHERQPQRAWAAVKALEVIPHAGDSHLFKAGIALVEQDYPSVQAELQHIVRRNPNDAEMVDLHRRATVIATRVTPRNPPVADAPGSPGPSSVNPRVGDVLDGFRLEARLGAGGWGQVFKAVRGSEVVALKVMHAKYSADRDFVACFRQEIQTLMRLPRHPNLLRILDFNYAVEPGVWYLVMEYIDGPTLEQYLQNKGPLTADLARHAFAPVAEALGAAHAAGIFHRDVKPSNLIFRRKDQRLVVVDFGLAAHAETLGQTKIGGLTLMFGSPEQKSGLTAEARSDVYSLGATIYFALLHDKPDLRNPVHFDAAEVPESLRSALTKALESNPRKRYADCREMHAVLSSPLAPQEASRSDSDSVPSAAPERKQPQIAVPEAGFTKLDAERKLPQIIVPKTDPGILICTGAKGADVQRVQQAQTDWAAFLGVPVTHTIELGGSVKLEMILIPPGRFMMGSPKSETGRAKDEQLHEVELTQPFYLGKFPVTQEQYLQVLQVTNPSSFCETGVGTESSTGSKTSRLPVEQVNCSDVDAFCCAIRPELGIATFTAFRLPTEAQWEYACRSGTRTRFHVGNELSSLQANFNGNLGRTSNVGSFANCTNSFGLFDMHGNVWEWCSDYYGDIAYQCKLGTDPIVNTGTNRVLRGGSWKEEPESCRSASRDKSTPHYRGNSVGFRLALVPSGSE